MSKESAEITEEINGKILSMLSNISAELASVKKRQDIFFERQMIIEKTLKQIQTQQEADKEEIMKRVVERSLLVMRSTDLSLKEIFGKEKFTTLTADLASAFTSLWQRLNKMQDDIDYIVRKP